MDDKEPKTEEAPAQQVTSTDKNTTKSNKDPRRVAAGKKILAEHNSRVREEKLKKKGGSKQSNNPKIRKI